MAWLMASSFALALSPHPNTSTNRIKVSHHRDYRSHELPRGPPTKIQTQKFPIRSTTTGSRCLRFSSPRSHLFSDSETARPPPVTDQGTIALSIADGRGVIIATDTLDPSLVKVGVQGSPLADPETKWKTIGYNLIAYWAANIAYKQSYFTFFYPALKLTSQQFSNTQIVTFEDLMYFNQSVVPSDEWAYGGTIQINVRDRFKTKSTPGNLLRMQISEDRILQEVITETSSALGTGAPLALEVLDHFSSIISSNAFATNEKVQELIVSKAILEALVGSTNCTGFSELLRGSPTKRWKMFSRTSMDELLHMYAVTQAHPVSVSGTNTHHAQPSSVLSIHPPEVVVLCKDSPSLSDSSQSAMVQEMIRLLERPSSETNETKFIRTFRPSDKYMTI